MMKRLKFNIQIYTDRHTNIVRSFFGIKGLISLRLSECVTSFWPNFNMQKLQYWTTALRPKPLQLYMYLWWPVSQSDYSILPCEKYLAVACACLTPLKGMRMQVITMASKQCLHSLHWTACCISANIHVGGRTYVRNIEATIVAVEEQKVLHILSFYL